MFAPLRRQIRQRNVQRFRRCYAGANGGRVISLVGFQHLRQLVQPFPQRHQTSQPPIQLVKPLGDEGANSRAGVARSPPHSQDLANLFQGKPQPLGVADEVEHLDGMFIVDPKTAPRTLDRFEQAQCFVIADGRHRNTC